MEKMLLYVLVVLNAGKELPACGSPVVSSQLGDGTDVADGQWPWQVSIQRGSSHHCRGSLVSDQWVLTAAHCFEPPYSSNEFVVRLGGDVRNTPHVVWRNVSNIVKSPSYIKETHEYDIALLRLQGPVTYTGYIMPVCLPAAPVTFPCGMECWVTGWGDITSDVTSISLQNKMVPLIDRETCDRMYHINRPIPSFYTLVYPSMLCAGNTTRPGVSCQGDSGGPLVCTVNGTWYQAGIVSCGEGGVLYP
ncbi:Belongs to the peptidase S1 family, partial [Pristimantis euphronides]